MSEGWEEELGGREDPQVFLPGLLNNTAATSGRAGRAEEGR